MVKMLVKTMQATSFGVEMPLEEDTDLEIV
jgi:hypothetical protein